MSEFVKLDKIPKGEKKIRRQMLCDLRERSVFSQQASLPTAKEILTTSLDNDLDLRPDFPGLNILKVFNGKTREISLESYDRLKTVLEMIFERRQIWYGKRNASGLAKKDDNYDSEPFLKLCAQKGITPWALSKQLFEADNGLKQYINSFDTINVQLSGRHSHSVDKDIIRLAFEMLEAMPDKGLGWQRGNFDQEDFRLHLEKMLS